MLNTPRSLASVTGALMRMLAVAGPRVRRVGHCASLRRFCR